jgi:hypothetical protein
MTRKCRNAWCYGEAEPGGDLCAWCWAHRDCFVGDRPRDPRNPWYVGPPKPAPPDPLKRWFPDLMRGDDEREDLQQKLAAIEADVLARLSSDPYHQRYEPWELRYYARCIAMPRTWNLRQRLAEIERELTIAQQQQRYRKAQQRLKLARYAAEQQARDQQRRQLLKGRPASSWYGNRCREMYGVEQKRLPT